MLIVYQLKLNTVSSILRCNNGSSIVCSGTGSDGSDGSDGCNGSIDSNGSNGTNSDGTNSSGYYQQ